MTYPKTKIVDVAEDFHGVSVPDPYRWLEDAGSEETKSWVDAQNAVTQSFLATCDTRESLRARLTQLWNYERYSVPFLVGGRFFYFKNNGLQNQAVLFMDEKELLDPNKLSESGTVALGVLSVSDKEK